MKLSTIVNKVKLIPNKENAEIVLDYHEFMKYNGKSERHQINNLNMLISYSNFLGQNSFYEINKKGDILSFLNTKIKNKDEDPEQKWITTYNDYFNRIKLFFRWFHNQYGKEDIVPMKLWKNPSFMELLKPMETKRISPYSETEIWEKEEFLSILKYESHKRNKAALALLWDLDARPHEVTLLRIKNIRFKERYGEGDIPHEAKTGTGPILLTASFPYVRDWLNEHPFQNQPNARLICNLRNGAPVKSDTINTVMQQLRKRIIRLMNDIDNTNEKEKLQYLLKTKKWNPYCIRHSAITSDSDYLPEYALKKNYSNQEINHFKINIQNIRNTVMKILFEPKISESLPPRSNKVPKLIT